MVKWRFINSFSKLTDERKKYFGRYFDDVDVRRQVNLEFANFSGGREGFHHVDSLRDRGELDAKSWWLLLDDDEILEIANLSLDEPVLEVVFFNEDEQGLWSTSI